jgi:glycosyltransferase involved in cell wall biosynthesis
MTSVSIAMATFNGAKHIAEQLESLASQTHRPAELVVTDDGSEDDTLRLLADFKDKSPFPVRIRRNETRLGYRRNFMLAAGLCRSDLIAFCDQDDIWRPDKLEQCKPPFLVDDVMLAFHNASVFSENGHLGYLSDGAPEPRCDRAFMSPWEYPLGFTQVFRRRLLDFAAEWERSADFNNVAEREAHDQWFFFLASVLGKVVYLPQPLVQYRQHGSNTCGWAPQSKIAGLRDRMALGPYYQVSRPRGAEARLRFLTSQKENLAAASASQIERAIAFYTKLDRDMRSRRPVYGAGNLENRLTSVIRLLWHGSYASKAQGGFGMRGLIKDLLVGVPISGLLLRRAMEDKHGVGFAQQWRIDH